MISRFNPKIVHGVGALIAYAVFSALVLVPGDKIVGSPYFLLGSVGMFMSMLWIMKHWPGRRMLAAVLLLALLVRVGAICQYPENSDINRYIWEGQIQLSGYNPFLYAPESEKLKHLRNEIWEDVNFKNLSAIYWPFSQLLFKVGAAISPTHWFFKSILVLFEAGIIFLLLMFLRPYSIDFSQIALYALNPLAIISVAGEGHLESILVFWIMLSLYGYWRKKPWLMYLALGLAIMTKLTPIIFLPLLVRRNNLKYFPFFLAPFALMLLFYDPENSFLSTFNVFIISLGHNSLLDYISRILIGVELSNWIAVLMAAGICGFIFFLTPDRIRSVFLVSAVLLIFAPTFHTWYLLLITPFLVLYRSRPWIIFHLTMLPLVFFFHPWATHPYWHDITLLQAIEFLPFIAAGIWCFWENRQHWPVRFQVAQSVSVIILADNKDQDISGCIQSLDSRDCPIEIIVVNSGFMGGFQDIARTYPDVNIITSPPERGEMIRAGIRSAKNDVVVLLSGDFRLSAGAISRMMGALRENDSVVGGCLGAAYDDLRPGLPLGWLLPVLTRIWVLASGISLKSQVPFFRREQIRNFSPANDYLADVEISLCMKEKGAIVFIPDGVTGTARRQGPAWKWTDGIKAIYVTMRYLTLRSLGFLGREGVDGHYAVPTDPAKKQAA